MLFLRLYPEDVHIMQVLQSQVFMRKVSPKQRERVRTQERRAQNAITGIVRDAVAQGQIPPERFTGSLCEELAFGICCVIDGSHSAITRQASLEDVGIKDPQQAIARTLDLLADGCGWRPLSTETDYDAVRARVRNTLFEEDLRRLQRVPQLRART